MGGEWEKCHSRQYHIYNVFIIHTMRGRMAAVMCCGGVIYGRGIEKPIRKKSSQGRGTALGLNLMMRGVFRSQSNEKIGDGGEEAVEPD